MLTCGSVTSHQILCIRKEAFSYCALVFFFLPEFCLLWIWTWYSTHSFKDPVYCAVSSTVLYLVSSAAKLYGR